MVLAAGRRCDPGRRERGCGKRGHGRLGASVSRSEGSSYAGHELTLTWMQGTPVAYYPSTDCDFSTHLGPHNIIINLTFCKFSVFTPTTID